MYAIEKKERNLDFLRGLDYLTITGDLGVKCLLPKDGIAKQCDYAHRFYDETYELKSHGTLSLGGDKQGDKIEWAGNGLRTLRAMGYTDDQILARYAEHRATRIDYAADCKGGGSVVEMVEALKHGAAHTWKEKILHYDVQNSDEGETLDLGSRHSKQFMRIYDKAFESKCDGIWTRAELQNRDNFARGIKEDMLKHGVQRAGSGWLRKVLLAPDIEWYERMIGDDYIDPSPVFDERTGNFELWLRMTVLPALEKNSRNPEGRKVIENFLELALALVSVK